MTASTSIYCGGLKVAAQVTSLSVHEPTKTLAVAVSRLDGDMWDGCVELWSLNALVGAGEKEDEMTNDDLDPEQKVEIGKELASAAGGGVKQSKTIDSAAAGATVGCAGRVSQPCGVSSLAWLNGCVSSGKHAGKPLVAIGRDDGNIEVFAWDRAKSLVPAVSLVEHDNLVNAVITPLADSSDGSGTGGSTLLASGSSDGTVRVWDLAAASTPGSNHNSVASVDVLRSPFRGACVQALASCSSPSSSFDDAFTVLAVAYGGASAQCGPCLGLWDRRAAVAAAQVAVQATAASPPVAEGRATKKGGVMLPFSAADAARALNPVESKFSCYATADEARGIGSCATPTCLAYARNFSAPPLMSKDSLEHALLVGFDDGVVARYDDRVLGRGAVKVFEASPQCHESQAVRALLAFRASFDGPPSTMGESMRSSPEDANSSTLGLVSASEACTAILTFEDITAADGHLAASSTLPSPPPPPPPKSTSQPAAPSTVQPQLSTPTQIDSRSDYVTALAMTSLPAVAGSTNKPTILTGGYDGQVRIIQLAY